MISNPTMSPVFISANTTPSSLLSQPSMTSLNMPSSSFPTAASTRNTTTRMSAKATTFSTCSDAVMYRPTHALTTSANLADVQMPAMIDMIDIAWAIKPFLMPCMSAGIKQIKRMISSMFIIALKCLYLRINIPKREFPIAKIGNKFYL